MSGESFGMRAGFVSHRKRVVPGFYRALREGGTRRLPWQGRGEAVPSAALRAVPRSLRSPPRLGPCCPHPHLAFALWQFCCCCFLARIFAILTKFPFHLHAKAPKEAPGNAGLSPEAVRRVWVIPESAEPLSGGKLLRLVLFFSAVGFSIFYHQPPSPTPFRVELRPPKFFDRGLSPRGPSCETH